MNGFNEMLHNSYFCREKEATYYQDLITSAKRENEEGKEYYLK
jgi:hypothetical protein